MSADQPSPATVIHQISDSGEEHVVGIGSLRVKVEEAEGFWFAQGLEIDYLAVGECLDQAKTNFEDGLSKTVDEHLKIHGSIEHLLVTVPADIWTQAMKDAMLYSQVSIHKIALQTTKIPFSEIEFIQTMIASSATANVASE